MAYQALASLYDRLMGHAPYDQWTSFTIEALKQYDESIQTIIDLGCGTGEITSRLAQTGYEMIGVDFSSDMLALAQQKAMNQNFEVKWILQDIRMLEGFTHLDAAISYCDVINYVTTLDELEQVFNRVAECLKPSGLFIFDVHSMNHLTDQMANHTFSEVDEDMAYIWHCLEGDHPGEVFHDLTFFTREEDGRYHRFDEYHHQRTYPIKIYQHLLNKAGFENIQITSDFTIKNEISLEKAERIFFLAQKRSESD